jgi:hypothetical protein
VTPRPSVDVESVTDLRKLLPDSVRGRKLDKTAYRGQDLVSSSGQGNDFMSLLLAGVNREPDDLRMAVAVDPSHRMDVSISALRIRGVDADRLFKAYVEAVKATYDGARVNETVLGGHTVHDLALTSQAATFIRPYGNVLFVVVTGDYELADEVFFSLP